MRPLTFRCQASNARALLENISGSINGWLQGCPDIDIVIRKHNDKRSLEQNKRLWAMYQEISDGVWPDGVKYDAETWHKYFKGRFIGYEETKLPNGKLLEVPISTTTLSVEEMTEYMIKIEAWGARRGIVWTI